MNKVVFKKDGALCINGTDVLAVTGFAIKSHEDGRSTIIAEFDASTFEVEVGVADFEAGATPQSETAPRNAIIQKMMEIGLTYSEALTMLEKSVAHLKENLGTYATGSDPLSTALYPDWQK